MPREKAHAKQPCGTFPNIILDFTWGILRLVHKWKRKETLENISIYSPYHRKSPVWLHHNIFLALFIGREASFCLSPAAAFNYGLLTLRQPRVNFAPDILYSAPEWRATPYPTSHDWGQEFRACSCREEGQLLIRWGETSFVNFFVGVALYRIC